MDWQPIETAPKKEDVAILLTNGEFTTIGSWELQEHHKAPRPHFSTERGYLFGKGFDRTFNPTHWMPLPPAPITTPAPQGD